MLILTETLGCNCISLDQHAVVYKLRKLKLWNS